MDFATCNKKLKNSLDYLQQHVATDNHGVLYYCSGVYRSKTAVKCSSLLKGFGLAPIGARRGVYAFSVKKKHCGWLKQKDST